METRKLVILLSLAAVAMATALWMSYSRSPDRELQQTQALMPGLAEQINGLTAVNISRGDLDTSIRLQEGRWVIEQKEGYPADAGKLRQLLLKLSDAKVIEEKTSNPELYSRLGVEEGGQGGTGGVQIQLKAGEQERGLIVGKRAMGKVGTYVRRAGEQQSLLADQVLEPDPAADAWMIREVMDVPAAQIMRIEIEQEDGELLAISKKETGPADFEVENVPAGRELSSSFAANSIGSALSRLQLEDVRRLPDEPGDSQSRARFTLRDGTIIQANVRTRDQESWVDFVVRQSGTEQSNALSAETADNTDGDLAIVSASKIQAAVQGWQFKLAGHTLQQFSRRMEQLLKPLE